ncbi:hypothetical protein QAD02_003987 [Eretmocerus hayati]|uniref:Uncharacterized protein n=1 Tax=Eretmocerus hayati TaxID=131215 RepID=A0ACC2NNP2_9HYME|nr:hypothetical protein QAD02_003987 [Eretmocerus hayati]
MNRNNRSGGIKFRELDYSHNTTSIDEVKKNDLRSKEDVLKLFAVSHDVPVKEGNCENVIITDDIPDSTGAKVIDEPNAQVLKIVTQPKSEKENVIKELGVQSNTVDSCAVKTVSNKRIYNVMIGKISTRKHKVWDSDGFLEVTDKRAVLKDENGKVLGSITVKPDTIEEGSRLCMGGKEIEIVDQASSQDVQSSQSCNQKKETTEPPQKKTKLSKNFVPVKSGCKLNFNYEPLIMPNPPVDLDQDTEQKLHEVSVDGCLCSVLRPHQREGITFLYKCIMGMNNPNYKGAILADEMGLGKTLQCIALIWTLLKKGPYNGGKPVLKRVIITAPASLCGNWNKEFKRWLGSIKISPYVVDSKQKVKDFTKTPRARVMIISYEMFLRNVDDVNSLNFDLLICDEGHRLKNSEVKLIKSLNQLSCRRRILLTGTPVQNDLQEFYTLANFVNPGIFGSFSEYKAYYEQAIVKSQFTTTEEEEVSEGQARAKELYERSRSFIIRRTNHLINQYLPQKHELVVFCRPTLEQKNLYSLVTDYWFNRAFIEGNANPLAVITVLKKICNHPFLFTSEKGNILDEVLPSIPTNLSAINNSTLYSSKFEMVKAVFQDLKQTQEKIVVVSYFTQTLDLLERVCHAESLQFCRLDGNTATKARTKIVDNFNSKDNSNCRVFLLSAKAGGVGLNLVGASRLILFDSDWNPANDLQALARIWREGQKRSTYLYRFLTTGTIEEKIYQRQISKTGLSEAVVDATYGESSLKLSKSELKDLFTLDTQTFSVTHDLMGCDCFESDLEENLSEEEVDKGSSESRNCQFDLKRKRPQQQVSINQLLSWQHYKQPIPEDLLKDLMLHQVRDIITFIFKNTLEK